MTAVEYNNTSSTPCKTCGAPTVYQPGTQHLVCTYCNTTYQIEQGKTLLVELDYLKYLEDYQKEKTESTKTVLCNNCKATSTINENLKSWDCPYCGSPLIEDNFHEERYIKPNYVLPFKISKNTVNGILKKWISSLWFAPNNIQRALLSTENIKGVYIPFWTFDSLTHTQYYGQRGEAYYVTVGSGQNKRTERRINWYNVKGEISNFYDDILVSGNTTLKRSILQEIQGGWDPKAVVEINNQYLEGFITEKYQLDLKDSFQEAKKIIDGYEYHAIKRDIGGDEQRVNESKTEHDNITFKHILLPIYVSSFLFENKVFTFYINGITGSISGERPYSKTKIFFAVLTVLVLLGIIILAKQ